MIAFEAPQSSLLLVADIGKISSSNLGSELPRLPSTSKVWPVIIMIEVS